MAHEHPDLQVKEHLRQQRIEWTVERVAWFFIYALLLAIIFGLLGQGPLSNAELQGTSGSVVMEYKRFMTRKSSSQLKVVLPPSPAQARIVLDQDYVEKIQLRAIVPEPERVVAETGGLAFVFNSDSRGPVQVQFLFEPQEAGMLDGWISVAGGRRLEFSQFVYP